MSTNTEQTNNSESIKSIRGYEAVIGIEVHVQLKTQSKIFSSDATSFDALDNENTSPVSIGMPGTLPVLNKKAVEYAVKTGLALNCEINRNSVLSRKNYFYPDLSKGYQISQYDQPICEKGYVELKINNKIKKINITRAHLEEDAGKSTHFPQYTLINYNRGGVPLLEIVSEPEIRSAEEAAEYCRTIRSIVRYIDVCDGNLEEGSLRCDCNVSVRKVGEKKFGTKVELKNINSFRFVEKAVDYEIQRQIDALENGERITQETRLYDADKNRTFTMREKENAQDYRYFPDPDLLPVRVSDELYNNLKANLPELPLARAERFQKNFQVSESDSQILTEDKHLSDFFEDCGKICSNYKSAANWIVTELLRELNELRLTIENSPIKAKDLAELILKIDQNIISGKIAKSVFKEMMTSRKSAEQIIKEQGLVQNSNSQELINFVQKVIQENPSQVLEYKAGKTKVMAFFVGAVMRLTKGKANPTLLNEILISELSKEEIKN